jgi:hypothetical protein
MDYKQGIEGAGEIEDEVERLIKKWDLHKSLR